MSSAANSIIKVIDIALRFMNKRRLEGKYLGIDGTSIINHLNHFFLQGSDGEPVVRDLGNILEALSAKPTSEFFLLEVRGSPAQHYCVYFDIKKDSWCITNNHSDQGTTLYKFQSQRALSKTVGTLVSLTQQVLSLCCQFLKLLHNDPDTALGKMWQLTRRSNPPSSPILRPIVDKNIEEITQPIISELPSRFFSLPSKKISIEQQDLQRIEKLVNKLEEEIKVGFPYYMNTGRKQNKVNALRSFKTKIDNGAEFTTAYQEIPTVAFDGIFSTRTKDLLYDLLSKYRSIEQVYTLKK